MHGDNKCIVNKEGGVLQDWLSRVRAHHTDEMVVFDYTTLVLTDVMGNSANKLADVMGNS